MNFGDSFSSSNSSSFVANLGEKGQKWTDPLAWMFGEKYTQPLRQLGDQSNSVFAQIGKPFAKVDKAINPLRKIPVYDNFAKWTENKPVDTAAIAAALYAGAGAGGGGPGGGGGAAGGAGGAGGGGGGSAIGGGSSASASGFNWQKMLSNALKQQGNAQQQQPQQQQTIDLINNQYNPNGGGYYA